MFKNYFFAACRNFWRNKLMSMINIIGLSIGISAALVIFLIVYYEYSFDRFEKDGDRIFRVVLSANFNGSEGHSAAVPAPLLNSLQTEMTGIDRVVPVFQMPGDGTAKVTLPGDQPDKPRILKNQQDIIFTNPQYFQLLSYHWIAGSATTLGTPFSVVLTENRAKKYFPGIPLLEVMGKQLVYNDNIRVTVAGLIKDLEQNSLFSAGDLVSFSTILNSPLKDRYMLDVWNDWMSTNQFFVQINKGSSPQRVEKQLQQIFERHQGKKDLLNKVTLQLQPLADIHFNNQLPTPGRRTANRNALYGLLAVGLFLLLLGCINFINLATAQGAQRAKEIGIRKTMGSSKGQLVVQFLSETLLVTSLATLLSVILTPLLLGVFSDFTPPGLKMDLLQQPVLLLFLLLLTLLVSLLAGIYPAMVLSGFNPVRAIKNQAFSGKSLTRSSWIRKTLTVSQFVVAQFFIIGSLMVTKQIHYSLNMDMGFNKEAVLTFETPYDSSTAHMVRLTAQLNALPGVKIASSGFFSPADQGVAFTKVGYQDKEDLKANIQLRWGDSNYLKVYQIPLLAGRNVRQVDGFKEFLINESLSKLLGFRQPADALGQALAFNGQQIPIVGVIRDFHAQSSHAPIDPLVFAGGRGTIYHVRLNPKDEQGKNWSQAIDQIQAAFRGLYPDGDFHYSFVDDNIARLYAGEQNLSRMLSWATGLMILISCLGLLGLVVHTTQRRTREIGIRKVFGASVSNILSLLSFDFIRLVLIGFLIAAPFAWWCVHSWLDDYAYRTPISWWIFVLTALLIVFFALLTLSIQTIRAASANPAASLRTQ